MMPHIFLYVLFMGLRVCHFCYESIKPLQGLDKESCIKTGELKQWKAGDDDSFRDVDGTFS